MCSCDDSEGPRVFEQRLSKAHATRDGKLHRCCECRRDIQLDEWHEDASGYWESWGRYRTCLRCVARRRAWAAVDECTPPFRHLAESIRKCIVEPIWRGRDANGRSIYVHHIARKVGRDYIKALRVARSELHREISLLMSQRTERRRAAAHSRWHGKRDASHIGEGI